MIAKMCWNLPSNDIGQWVGINEVKERLWLLVSRKKVTVANDGEKWRRSPRVGIAIDMWVITRRGE